jgi:hypothetical protein
MPTGARLAPRPYLGTENVANNPLGPSEENDSHSLASSRSNSCGGEHGGWGRHGGHYKGRQRLFGLELTFEVHKKLGSSGNNDRI